MVLSDACGKTVQPSITFMLTLFLHQDMVLWLHQEYNSVQLKLREERRVLMITQGRKSLQLPPTEENIDRIHHMMMDTMLLTINKIFEPISVSRGKVETILQNQLDIASSAQWLQRFLTPDPKHTRLLASWKNLTLFDQINLVSLNIS